MGYLYFIKYKLFVLQISVTTCLFYCKIVWFGQFCCQYFIPFIRFTKKYVKYGFLRPRFKKDFLLWPFKNSMWLLGKDVRPCHFISLLILKIITLPYHFGLLSISYMTYLNKFMPTKTLLQVAHKIYPLDRDLSRQYTLIDAE